MFICLCEVWLYVTEKIVSLPVNSSRIYVDLPDAENRLKILKIFLTPENLEPGFQFEKLAKETEGYSGSDLKVGIRFPTSACGGGSFLHLNSFFSLWVLYCRICALLLLTDLFKNYYRKNKRYT